MLEIVVTLTVPTRKMYVGWKQKQKKVILIYNLFNIIYVSLVILIALWNQEMYKITLFHFTWNIPFSFWCNTHFTFLAITHFISPSSSEVNIYKNWASRNF